MKRIILVSILVLTSLVCPAKSTGAIYLSRFAPKYFGPNAFPIPDMLDGRTSSTLKAELYADSYFGTMAGKNIADDYTSNLFVRVSVPLFTPRVNLSIWGNLLEYFSSGPEINAFRGISEEGTIQKTFGLGDIYISTDIQVLKQERMWVDCTLRAALKTASGDLYQYSRYYDCPGYFFDGSFGRDFRLSEKAVLRTSVSGGFLCWQLDNWRQNDAFMYGVQLSMTAGRFFISETWGGYIGWRDHGDSPMSIKTRLSWSFGAFFLNLEHQYGFRDWPFHQVRFGVGYNFNILKRS
ncbi:MAG: hypothetical protein ACI3ZL_02405 [Candidatus Cryptobacteroides sp.]